MKAYLNLRKIWDPLRKPNKVMKEYECSSSRFQDRINSFEYKADPLSGLFDHTADPNKFFDNTRESGRDCDDFQRQWSWWGVYNGYESTEYIICDPTTLKSAFSTMHVIGVLRNKETGRFFLTNYNMYGPFEDEEKALDYMRYFPSYMKDKLWVRYRKVKL